MGQKHVLIVGGGVIGLFTARFLRQLGCSVTIVERRTVGSGASHGNCGYVSPSHVMPLCVPGAIRHSLPSVIGDWFGRGGALSIPPRWDPRLWSWMMRFANACQGNRVDQAAEARHALLVESKKLYQALMAECSDDLSWTEEGLWMIHRSQHGFDEFEPVADRLRDEFDLSIETVGGDELVAREPALKSDLAGGFWFPADAHLHPAKLVQFMLKSLRHDGVNVIEQTEVSEIRTEPEQITLVTDFGDLSGDDVVITAGAETPRFESALGCRIPIVPGKGYSMSVPMPSTRIRSPMIFEDCHVAITPYRDRLRIGSTMSLCGYDASINPKKVARIRDLADGYIREGVASNPEEQWSGWRPMASDDYPFIGQSMNHRSVWVASGNGMIGLSTAPATGQLVSELVMGTPPSIDPVPYSLSRLGSDR